jgi:hypothetical protein
MDQRKKRLDPSHTIYRVVKHMVTIWFNTKTGVGWSIQSRDGLGEHGSLGAGYLMDKFTRFVLFLAAR